MAQDDAQLSSLADGLGDRLERNQLLASTAIAEGRVGALPRRVSQSWEKVSQECEQLAMILKDEEQVLLWEFHHRGRANFTETAVAAGGRAGRPVDLQKQPVGGEKLLDAVMWMWEKYHP